MFGLLLYAAAVDLSSGTFAWGVISWGIINFLGYDYWMLVVMMLVPAPKPQPNWPFRHLRADEKGAIEKKKPKRLTPKP